RDGPCASCLLVLLIRRPRRSPLFPYTTLFRSVGDEHREVAGLGDAADGGIATEHVDLERVPGGRAHDHRDGSELGRVHLLDAPRDRKSTRLNSSHVKISYAVFCLKKKKQRQA